MDTREVGACVETGRNRIVSCLPTILDEPFCSITASKADFGRRTKPVLHHDVHQHGISLFREVDWN